MPEYKSHEIPPELANKSQLAKLGRKLTEDQEPVAVEVYGSRSSRTNLYYIRDSVAKTERARVAAEARRIRAALCQVCGRDALLEQPEFGAYCPACYGAEYYTAMLERRPAARADSESWARLAQEEGVLVVVVAGIEVLASPPSRATKRSVRSIGICGMDGKAQEWRVVPPERPKVLKHLPTGGVPVAEVIPEIRAACAGRRLVSWRGLEQLLLGASELGVLGPCPGPTGRNSWISYHYAQWVGEIPHQPGSAARFAPQRRLPGEPGDQAAWMAALIRRMAGA